MYLIIISFILAIATTALIHNTLPYQTISDADRYIQSIANGTTNSLGVQLLAPLIGETTNDFNTVTNFLMILAIGYLVYSSTNSWRITILALLGFSVSLMTYFSLLAQAIVIIIGLFLWTKVETKSLSDHIIYLAAAAFGQLTHKFGGPLVVLIFLVKRLEVEDSIFPVWSKRLAYLGYAIAAIILLSFFSSPERVTFFYYFLLPISLGPFDILYWLGLFSLIFWMLLKCENNTRELLIVSACFIGVAINYALSPHPLEIDAWRLLIFAELVALIKIGQSDQNGDLLKWTPWFLIAMGIERLIIGLLV